MSSGRRRPRSDEDADLGFAPAIPLGCLAGAEDIAKTVLVLASDDAAHITAAEIVFIYRAPK